MAAISMSLINDNKPLQRCYDALNDLVYLILSERLHLGFWDADTYRVFPLSRALRRMEERLYELLDVAPESHILDAGCGCGRVALHMAGRGLYVTAIDVTDRHLERARRNILQMKDLGGRVTVEKMDYHHLEPLAADSFDGVYAMESLCHATNPLQVFHEFHRILRPGGQLVIHDADRPSEDVAMGGEAATMIKRISELGAMPTFQRSKDGLYRKLLEEAGFTDVRVHDYSENVKPMLRLFWLLSVVPRSFVKLFGLRNTLSHVDLGWWAYKEQRHWRYVAIAARKPIAGT